MRHLRFWPKVISLMFARTMLWVLAAIAAISIVGCAINYATAQNTQTARVEVTVWQRVSDGSLYLSTRPEGGRWSTHPEVLDMSQLSGSGRFRQGSAITVEVPVPPSEEMIRYCPTAPELGYLVSISNTHRPVTEGLSAIVALMEYGGFGLKDAEWRRIVLKDLDKVKAAGVALLGLAPPTGRTYALGRLNHELAGHAISFAEDFTWALNNHESPTAGNRLLEGVEHLTDWADSARSANALAEGLCS